MRPLGWLGLLAVVPLLAGCFGGGDGSPAESTTAPSTFAVTVGKPIAPEAPKVTSTLHLMDQRRLTTVEPDAFEPVRIPVGSLNTIALASASGSVTAWNFTWPADVGVVRGTYHIVVDVQGVVLNEFAVVTGGPYCFWSLSISVFGEGDAQGSSGGSWTGCVPEPVVVPEGIRTFDVPFELPTAPYAQGNSASLQVTVPSSARSPDSSLDLLTGSITQDSTITFEGVGWPLGLDQVTLLTMTT